MKDDTATERLDLRLTRNQMARLLRIQKITETTTKAEVVRNALKAYESLLNKRKV